jgi:hypothetical protein
MAVRSHACTSRSNASPVISGFDHPECQLACHGAAGEQPAAAKATAAMPISIFTIATSLLE